MESNYVHVMKEKVGISQLEFEAWKDRFDHVIDHPINNLFMN